MRYPEITTCSMLYQKWYLAYETMINQRQNMQRRSTALISALDSFIQEQSQEERSSGFKRMEKCRQALEAIDRQGWKRSFHQRQFHEDFIRASARVFWRTEPAGQFERDHQYILEHNGWDSLHQEILVSTPRRFGKTISVSMFAAAMIYSAPKVEVSIYSTCKRISQKLLENIWMFLDMVYQDLQVKPMKVIRHNMEQIVLMGPEGPQDKRKVNSYPSKVTAPPHPPPPFPLF